MSACPTELTASKSVFERSGHCDGMEDTAEGAERSFEVATGRAEQVDERSLVELHDLGIAPSEQDSLAKLGTIGVSKGLARVIHRSSGGVTPILLALAVASEELRLSNSLLREQVERHGKASPLLCLIGLSAAEFSLLLYVVALPQGAASMRISRREPGIARSLFRREVLLHTGSGIELAPFFDREELLSELEASLAVESTEVGESSAEARSGPAHALMEQVSAPSVQISLGELELGAREEEAGEPTAKLDSMLASLLIENELLSEQVLSREIAVGRRELELAMALGVVLDRETRVAERECELDAKRSALQQKQEELGRISERLVQRRMEQNTAHYALREAQLALVVE
ncbi:MAG: hypothetical protein GY811_18345 [Myxococcales bacterium]|nr:hypothetical protein [Myxococcales bacterium]